MSASKWHKLYPSSVDAPPEVLFRLISDMPNYGRWLPGSEAFGRTTDVEPYPVQLGSRYHAGKPDEPGENWQGMVTGFQPPGSIDFHHTIDVRQLRAAVDVHVYYSFEPRDNDDDRTDLKRWLVLDLTMPLAFRPLRRFITSSFNEENFRTLAAVREYSQAKSHSPHGHPPTTSQISSEAPSDRADGT